MSNDMDVELSPEERDSLKQRIRQEIMTFIKTNLEDKRTKTNVGKAGTEIRKTIPSDKIKVYNPLLKEVKEELYQNYVTTPNGNGKGASSSSSGAASAQKPKKKTAKAPTQDEVQRVIMWFMDIMSGLKRD